MNTADRLNALNLEQAEPKALKNLDLLAEKLLTQKVPVHERCIRIRTSANEQGLNIRDNEIFAITAKARRKLQGHVDAVGVEDEFDLPDTAWAWDGVIAAQVPNLLVALQKVGKSALMAGLIAHWHYGSDGEYLGHKLIGPCPPVIIAGTDQTLVDWCNLLAPVGLMTQRENGKWGLAPNGPIKQLWHRANPIYLDMEGIEKITDANKQWPGALNWLDTYAALVAPLGLAEEKPEIAEPLYNLEESTQSYNATNVAIHHASKSRANERASNASRNSNALPAAASQIISLHWLNPDAKSDQRVTLSTEGRNGTPIEEIIEQCDRSQWQSHGSAEQIKEQQRLEKVEAKLTDRQAVALELLRDLWNAKHQELSAPALLKVEKELFGTERQARRSLDDLVTKGLAEERRTTTPQGKSGKFFRPAGSDLSASRGGIQEQCPECPEWSSSHTSPPRFETRPLCL